MGEKIKTSKEIREEIEQERIESEALLQSLEIPQYTDRNLKALRVKSITGRSIQGSDGWSALAPLEVRHILKIGDPYILEKKGFNQVSGWLIHGKWYGRKSDQEIEREINKWREDSEAKRKAYVEEQREEWTRREAELPNWAREVVENNRDKSEGFESEPMGWGYVLIACELAVLYYKMGEVILDNDPFSIEDSEEIRKFANDNGTSGNQHGFALMIAKRQLRKELN